MLNLITNYQNFFRLIRTFIIVQTEREINKSIIIGYFIKLNTLVLLCFFKMAMFKGF